MGLNQNLQFSLIQLVLLSYLVVISASNFISDGVFGDHSVTGRRNILQAKQNCPVNFESQDYSVITNQCKGPQYPANMCCPAFKEFACPFSDQINDLSNNCASTMFSYINLAGKYPPGLFANECREGKVGLACDAQSPSQSANNTSASMTSFNNPSPLLLLGVVFVGGLLLPALL